MTVKQAANQNSSKNRFDVFSQGDAHLSGNKEHEKSTDEDSFFEETFNWEKEKQKKLHFFDDGTKSYFWYG